MDHFLEGMACYEVQLLAPAEGFGLWPSLLVPFRKNVKNCQKSENLKNLNFFKSLFVQNNKKINKKKIKEKKIGGKKNKIKNL